jgi:hypothetical protein
MLRCAIGQNRWARCIARTITAIDVAATSMPTPSSTTACVARNRAVRSTSASDIVDAPVGASVRRCRAGDAHFCERGVGETCPRQRCLAVQLDDHAHGRYYSPEQTDHRNDLPLVLHEIPRSSTKENVSTRA